MKITLPNGLYSCNVLMFDFEWYVLYQYNAGRQEKIGMSTGECEPEEPPEVELTHIRNADDETVCMNNDQKEALIDSILFAHKTTHEHYDEY